MEFQKKILKPRKVKIPSDEDEGPSTSIKYEIDESLPRFYKEKSAVLNEVFDLTKEGREKGLIDGYDDLKLVDFDDGEEKRPIATTFKFKSKNKYYKKLIEKLEEEGVPYKTGLKTIKSGFGTKGGFLHLITLNIPGKKF